MKGPAGTCLCGGAVLLGPPRCFVNKGASQFFQRCPLKAALSSSSGEFRLALSLTGRSLGCA